MPFTAGDSQAAGDFALAFITAAARYFREIAEREEAYHPVASATSA